MKVRMEKEVENAAYIAKELQRHSKVKAVYYPGLEDHKGRKIHYSQASSGGAVLTFDLGNYENVKNFFAHVTIPIVAVSLGGVESILSYPFTMSHAVIPEEGRIELGVTDGLVRLSCGIEDKDDLLNDLLKALDHVNDASEFRKKVL